MSKYQQAIENGYSDEQVIEYFQPKVNKALESVGEEKTAAYLVDQMGVPANKVNLFLGKPNETIQPEKLPVEQDYITIPKRIKRYTAAGMDQEEAIERAKADYYHAKGFPAPKAGEQFQEHVWQPYKEGIATVGAGFVSLLDDIMTGVGLQNNKLTENVESIRKDLSNREKEYEEKYGADVVREVSKKIPAVLAAVANPSSMVRLAATEAPLAYAEVRGEDRPIEEAVVAGSIAVAIPMAMGLTKGISDVMTYPARRKSKLLKDIEEKTKQEMLDVLEYAESKGIILTPAQLTNDTTINQLTDLISRTPAVAQRFKNISDQNKAIIMEAYANLKQSISPQDVSSALLKGEVDPFGREIQKTLLQAKGLRHQRVKEAYKVFDDLASDIGVPIEAKELMVKQLNEIKEWGQKTNNPEGVARLIDDAIRRVQGTPGSTTPTETINPLAALFTGQTKTGEEALQATLADLNTISKQLYKQGKAIQDPTLKSVWENTRKVINDHIAKLSDPETLDVLQVAKQQHIAKERLYGLNPDFKAIASATNKSQTDEIVNNLLKGKTARSNAAQLKKEFALAGKPEMSKALAKRYIEDAVNVNVREVKDIGKFDLKEIIKGYSKLDPEVVKLLAGEGPARELRQLIKLAKSNEALDKLTTYQPMTGTSPSIPGIINDYFIGAVKNKFIGDILSSDKGMKYLLKIMSSRVPKKEKVTLTKQMAREANLGEDFARVKPASEVIGEGIKTVYRASILEKGSSRGPLGKGTYYFLDETNAVNRQAGTEKKLFKFEIDPDEIATMDTVSHVVGKKTSTFKDVNPTTIEELKTRGFKGLMDEGELVIFD